MRSARKTHRAGADIDVALDAGSPISIDILLKLYGEIELTTIPLEVDLVDMHSISDEMQDKIQFGETASEIPCTHNSNF